MRGFAFFILLFAAVVPSRADDLSKAEIGKRGKAVTAFVDVAGLRSGTAFCVHPSGLFVTNEHVVAGIEKEQIKLVVDAGQSTQRILPATVVRSDKSLDLALLRVASKDALPSLPLGTMQGVSELMDVVAFGFPLGFALSPDHKEYPAISVNAGKVSSLRAKGGQVERIQIDISVTYGNSGSPVLDGEGKLVGVIVSGVPGQRGINLAIPVSHVARFLSAPDIQFTPPDLTRATLDKPTEFTARVVSLVPGSKETKLQLILQAGEQPAREFPMTPKDGTYRVSAMPVVKPNNERLELSIRLGTGMVAGQCDDMVFKIGGKPVKLSGIRRIELKPKSLVTLVDGKSIEGEITGLGQVEMFLGDEKIKMDLSKAAQIEVQQPAEIFTVTASIIATVDGKEVGRIKVSIRVRETGSIAAGNASPVAINPPAMATDVVTKMLPEPFTDVRLGGGGRYLIFLLPRVKKLAVFDMNEARITGYLSLDEDKVFYAAGMNHVVIGQPRKGTLERWSLATFERELTVHPPFQDEINSVLMGYASSNWVVVNGRFLDLQTFKPLPIQDEKGNNQIWGPGGYLSADGTVCCFWDTSFSPGNSTTHVLEGSIVKRYGGGTLGHVLPGADGKTIFTAHGIVSLNLNRADAEDEKLGYCLPAVSGNFFISITPASERVNRRDKEFAGELKVHLVGYPGTLAKPEKIGHGLQFNNWDREAFGVWRRIYFMPLANTVVVLPTSNDRLVLYKLDINTALEQSGVNYLLITSQPPREIKAGETFKYPIMVKAKRTPVSFKLETGPKGMKVSTDGVVTWAVPVNATLADESVILTVRDSQGQEAFHAFGVKVVK
jgi:hypothetical protein